MSVAVGWQIFALTGNALDLGLIGLAQFLPMMCLTLVVGHVADRYDRRRIVAVCMALEGAATLLLAVAAVQGFGGKALVYLTVMVISSARAFEAPTLPTLIPAIVPRAWIPRATALSASSNQIAQIAGPALGGIGYGIGAGWIYGIASLMYVFGLVSILRVRTERAPRTGRRRPGTRCSPASASLPAGACCWAHCRWICLPCSWAAQPPCCPSLPRISCMPAPGHWVHCAPRPPWVLR
ncbi:major Facilitator Superfamily protein [Bordetella holmesii 44057]|nr:major Facilitator Superfamily protein [Bordetella holmesii 44057]